MSLGVTVTARTAPPSRGAPTDTDGWFVAAVTDVGTLNKAVEVRDLVSFETAFGPRVAGNIKLWDAMDVFFREGGKRAVVSRGAVGAGLTACLNSFINGLGPGQLSVIGYDVTTSAPIQSLWTHAQANNRVVVASTPPGITDPVALDTYVGGITDTTDGRGGFFGFDAMVPPPAGVIGAANRQIEAAPVIAALCARVDATGNPNQAAAGRWLPLQYVLSLTSDPTMAVRETLLNSGVNTMAEVFGVLENYGFQTPVVQDVNTPFWQFNCSRARMAIVARAQSIGEDFMFKTIDGQGRLANALKGALDSMLLDFWHAGALFGETPSDAFYVDTGPSVNTPASIAQGKLRATAELVLSLHAKSVEIELVAIPVGGRTTGAGPEVGGLMAMSARTTEVTPDFSSMTVAEVMEWVGDDPERAAIALAAERAGENRSTLISQLESEVE